MKAAWHSAWLGVMALAAPVANAQWRILDAHTEVDLRGISAVDENIAWASGARGTVLLTVNAGQTWRTCTPPSGAANLDFSSIQAFDDNTAVVMSTGVGASSTLYKTSDGCRTWKQVLGNTDAAGSFVSLRRATAFEMYLLGAAVNGRFVMYSSGNAGDTWSRSEDAGLAVPKEAGNRVLGSAALTNVITTVAFVTSGAGASVYTWLPICGPDNRCAMGWAGRPAPLAKSSAMAGAVAVAGHNVMVQSNAVVTGIGTMPATILVTVGGDPEKPEQGNGTAAFSTDNGATWRAAAAPPRGYRTAIDYDGERGRFIAVGPNGSDETVDDGLIWHALTPGPGEPADADKGWSAISLPFIVGAHGRIGRISRPADISAAATNH